MMQSRLTLPDVSSLDSSQQAVYDSILSTRGNLSGPFLAWMHSPLLASHAEKLGAFCRYQSGFDLIESELMILCVAAHFHCQGEQQIHEPIAAKEGLSTNDILLLRQQIKPALLNERQVLIYSIVDDLLRNNRIRDPVFQHGVQNFGERGMVELVGIVGYYTLVAMTLNAFEMSNV
jgi:4-carboxymuconolactone decarboxylase